MTETAAATTTTATHEQIEAQGRDALTRPTDERLREILWALGRSHGCWALVICDRDVIEPMTLVGICSTVLKLRQYVEQLEAQLVGARLENHRLKDQIEQLEAGITCPIEAGR
jgi:hypothetical protein